MGTLPTSAWEPEILLIDRGSNTYFTHYNANQFITFLKCVFLDFLLLLLFSLTVQINLALNYRLVISLSVGKRTKSAGDQKKKFPTVSVWMAIIQLTILKLYRLFPIQEPGVNWRAHVLSKKEIKVSLKHSLRWVFQLYLPTILKSICLTGFLGKY